MSRYTLTQAAAERLLKDLDIAVVKTMSRVVADAREHLWLLESISTTDVLTDSDFQRRLCRHVGMRGKLRMRREELFMILDGIRRVPHRNYPDVLMQISELTGQVEKSVASEVLALLEPDQPTIDREVRELMPRYGFQPLPESPLFDECVAYHHCLRQVMEQVLALPLAGTLLARLDQAIGEGAGQLSPLRKLNLLLSGSYRTVALLPNLEAVRRAIPRHHPMPAPAPVPLSGRILVAETMPGLYTGTRPITRYSSRAFWTCSRFSASSQTTDCGPLMTSAVTSSPRCAGRQCMKSASGWAVAIIGASTQKSEKAARRASFSAS